MNIISQYSYLIKKKLKPKHKIELNEILFKIFEHSI
jgi:hypothetical protein